MSAAPAERATVLVVEDDEDVRTLLLFSLRRAGFRAVEAANGAEALRVATAAQPDLVLLDIGLPHLDGKAVCRILQSKGVAAPPVIFLTASSRVADRIEGLELGAVDYVVKPFDRAELIARVRAHLRGRDKLAQLEHELLQAAPRGRTWID